MLIKTVL